jgi:hypothetical protein
VVQLTKPGSHVNPVTFCRDLDHVCSCSLRFGVVANGHRSMVGPALVVALGLPAASSRYVPREALGAILYP